MFHDWGLAVYEPEECRLFHVIQGTDIIPGTQEYVCGDKGKASFFNKNFQYRKFKEHKLKMRVKTICCTCF